jgi:hypothetical protein
MNAALRAASASSPRWDVHEALGRTVACEALAFIPKFGDFEASAGDEKRWLSPPAAAAMPAAKATGLLPLQQQLPGQGEVLELL